MQSRSWLAALAVLVVAGLAWLVLNATKPDGITEPLRSEAPREEDRGDMESNRVAVSSREVVHPADPPASTGDSVPRGEATDAGDPWANDVSIRSFRDSLQTLSDPVRAAATYPIPALKLSKEGGSNLPGRPLSEAESEQLRALLVPFDSSAQAALIEEHRTRYKALIGALTTGQFLRVSGKGEAQKAQVLEYERLHFPNGIGTIPKTWTADPDHRFMRLIYLTPNLAPEFYAAQERTRESLRQRKQAALDFMARLPR